MDLDSLKEQWQQHAQQEVPDALEVNVMTSIITRRAADLRRDVRRRLRREATYYLPMLAMAVAVLLSDVTVVRLGFAALLLIVLGGIAATLWFAQRRITETMLDRSVLDALTDLRAKIDAAARAYLAAYVVTFACSTALLAAIVWWRMGTGFGSAAAAIGLFASWWSYRSGQTYVERLFRRDRANLSDCLGQLNADLPS